MSDDGPNSQAVPEAPPSPPDPAAPTAVDTVPVQADGLLLQTPPGTIEPLADLSEPAVVEPEMPALPPEPPVPAEVIEHPAEPAPALPLPPRQPPALLIYFGWQALGLVATLVVAALLVFLALTLVGVPDDPTATAIGPILADRLAVTLPLNLMALALAALMGQPLGIVAGRRPRGLTDHTLSAVFLIGTSVAAVWLAMLLALVFAVLLRWVPPGGFVPWVQDPLSAFASLLMPALALALPLAAGLALATRDALVAAQAAPMSTTSRAMGTPERDIFRSALRNAAPTVAGGLGLQVCLLVPASVIVENVFYLPGLGRLILTSLSERDIPTLSIGLVALVSLIALARLGANLIRYWLDPTVRETA